jgi:hypothetical protein
MADCVEGWVKGEVEDIREGMKRQVGRMRRGVRDFGSKVFGSD